MLTLSPRFTTYGSTLVPAGKENSGETWGTLVDGGALPDCWTPPPGPVDGEDGGEFWPVGGRTAPEAFGAATVPEDLALRAADADRKCLPKKAAARATTTRQANKTCERVHCIE